MLVNEANLIIRISLQKTTQKEAVKRFNSLAN